MNVARPRSSRRDRLVAAVISTGCCWLPAIAHAQQLRPVVDVTASAGASSNPFLLEDAGDAAVFIEGAVAPRLTVSDERGNSTIGGYVRGTAYLNGGYDPTWAIGAFAQSQRSVSERLVIRGSVQLDSSIIGERFNDALLNPPSFAVDPVPTQPTDVPTPGLQAPAPLVPQIVAPDITLLGIRQRQTSIGGSVGASYQLSTRDSLSADVQAQRSDNGGQLASFSSYGASIGYSRSLSELTQIGLRLNGQWTDFGDGFGGGTGEVYQPQITLDTRLSPLWRLSAGAGLLITETKTPFTRTSATGVSATARLCRDGERSEACLFGSRDAGPNGLGFISRRLNFGGSYSARLSADDSLRAAVDYSRVDGDGALGVAENFSFFSATAGYDRRLNQRLRGGANAGFRRSDGSFGSGSDFSASLFISARLGSLQ
jgi:hypothetical protein